MINYMNYMINTLEICRTQKNTVLFQGPGTLGRNKQFSGSVGRQQRVSMRKFSGTTEPHATWSRKTCLDKQASVHARILATKLWEDGHTGLL